ncbi:TniQ family protein [Nostoc sp. FACHB-152]|uniref:TniQ family protein n=1 Tax=unclassified Nostoc TaxID=2593658 RepID=UPI0016820AA2|nr:MULTISPECIES: TniQ family protein [unclassified Nostoc]MBD2449175.1 TniQ family protein [Nostoc sp. FACHB-152]MBD2466324.1 TniQ family protein [Nostoc sp. FACHB-145]
MLTNELTTYEYWDLKKVAIPSRSHLYQLEPVGLRTPMVESLTGYIERLAEAHCVPPEVLISRTITPLLKQIFLKSRTSRDLRSLFDRATAINGTGDIAIDLVQALQNLTLIEDLHLLTLLFWAEVIPTRNLFRTQSAWCALCYEEWRLTKQVIYKPLIWNINSVKACHLHKIYLCFQCPHCQQEFPLLSWRSQPGYCSKCGGWLGMKLAAKSSSEYMDCLTVSQEELQWQTWIVEVIGELISSTLSFNFPPAKEEIAKSLSLVIDIVTDGNVAEFARLMEIPKNTLWMWQTGKALPVLDMLLKICYCLEISLLDLLKPEQLAAKSFKKISHKTIRRSAAQRVSPKLFEANQVQDALLAILESNNEPPPTMEEVATSLGYNRRTIFRHFPDLCRAISAKYLSYGKACHKEKIQQSCREVKQIVLKLHHQGEYPSEARVSEIMAHPGYLRYKQVRAALNETRREIGV